MDSGDTTSIFALRLPLVCGPSRMQHLEFLSHVTRHQKMEVDFALARSASDLLRKCTFPGSITVSVCWCQLLLHITSCACDSGYRFALIRPNEVINSANSVSDRLKGLTCAHSAALFAQLVLCFHSQLLPLQPVTCRPIELSSIAFQCACPETIVFILVS